MKKSDRAKIFSSFSPLKGFYEEMAKREKVIVPKAELADDRIYEIDRILHEISVGDIISVVHYKDGEYVKTLGCISRFEPQEKALTVAKTRIAFDDIYDMEHAK